MDNRTETIISLKLRDMMLKGWISICDVDACLKLANIVPIGQTYKELRALHCVNFTDMPRELALQIPDMLADVFDGLLVGQPAQLEREISRSLVVVNPAPKAPMVRQSFLRRLGVIR